MSLPYFYEPGIQEHTVIHTLSNESNKHAIQVLRMRVGQPLHITNGHGLLFTATVAEAGKKNCVVQVTSQSLQPAGSRKVRIGISLLKNAARLEWFLEKATELGVCELVPLLCHRTERQHFRYDRMQQIVVSAMLQSQQAWLPVLRQPLPVQQVIDGATAACKLIAHCEAGEKQNLSALPPEEDVFLLIGPEGDFTPGEIAAATQQRFVPVSLGNTRLRTETAGVMAATLLIHSPNR